MHLTVDAYKARTGRLDLAGVDFDDFRYLFSDDEGRTVVDRLDRRIEDLPGLDGLSLLADAVGILSHANAAASLG